MKVNEKFNVFEVHVKDGKPLGLDDKPTKTQISQKWRSEKYRMDYSTSCNNSTGSGYHLKGFDDLIEHIKDCLAGGHVIEITPDYNRPDKHKY